MMNDQTKLVKAAKTTTKQVVVVGLPIKKDQANWDQGLSEMKLGEMRLGEMLPNLIYLSFVCWLVGLFVCQYDYMKIYKRIWLKFAGKVKLVLTWNAQILVVVLVLTWNAQILVVVLTPGEHNGKIDITLAEVSLLECFSSYV